MPLYANATTGPVVIDTDGHVLPGGEQVEFDTETEVVAQQVACGRLVNLTELCGTTPAEMVEPKEND